MALVFKIKHNETLRRWVVSQSLPQTPSDLTLSVRELLLKVRELFRFSENDVLVVTYVDKEGDVVTVADDQDLVDACFVQGLNPLRLEVKALETGQNSGSGSPANASPNSTSPPPHFDVDASGEGASRPAFPQATADAIKQFLAKCTQNIDPNLQPAVLISHIRKVLKEFVKTLVQERQKLKLSPRSEKPPTSMCPVYSPCANQTTESSDVKDQIVHFGVRCDGCNCHPIRGLRYKSTTVFNYDLCSTCFHKMGNESDYERIEKPVRVPYHGSCHELTENGKKRVPMKWVNPFASGSDGWKSECPFLQTPLHYPDDKSQTYNASFVKEFSDFMGEALMPHTRFVRTLRLKNNGSVPWPQGTCLVHIGGDSLALESAIVLKLPEGGLSTGLEFDVPVDMIAPNKVGNYISHWCLMAPDGDKFGQSVWMAVQVVGDVNGLSQTHGASSDEMIVSKEECGMPQPKEEHFEVFKGDDSTSMSQCKDLGSDMTDKDSSSAKQAVESGQFIVSASKDNENISYPTDEVDGFSLIEKPSDGGNYKTMRAPVINSELISPQPVSVITEQYGRSVPTNDISRQELNLHELELMGFKNHSLNAFLLSKNEQDLQLTLDDLLLGSGWDNLLKDLQEMGFDDVNTNLRLLIKNEGSIKRVVKELVELEKGESAVPIV